MYSKKTFSVSRINEIVSAVIVGVWVLLAVKFLFDQKLVNVRNVRVNWFVVGSSVGCLLAVMAMMFGRGRGRFTERKVLLYRRTVPYKEIHSSPN